MSQGAAGSNLGSIGNYDLLQKVGEGGAGAVYRARRHDTGQIVAVKVMPANLAKNQVLLKRFQQEFLAASSITHPNIVRALDYCDTGEQPFLVMEFVDGESLGARLEREGRLPEEESIRIITQVCMGLQKAHQQGMIHRDIKPDNVLVTRDGTAKLTDLGLVKDLMAEVNLTRTGRGLGTPHFMAPEQFRNAKNADVRCDIYSVGATLYQMVTGVLPFAGVGPIDAMLKKTNNDLPAPRQVVPSISERTDRAIRKAMSADPKMRPASCQEFLDDLTGTGPLPVAPEVGGSAVALKPTEAQRKSGVLSAEAMARAAAVAPPGPVPTPDTADALVHPWLQWLLLFAVTVVTALVAGYLISR
jgi:serine/threonine protein kinase